MNIKYPNAHIRLAGEDGNAFSIMGRTQGAMRHAGCTPAQIKAYYDDATSGDYDHLLRVTMTTVSCDIDDEGWDDDDDDE